jgi:mono/diheme cytochrome c family protein
MKLWKLTTFALAAGLAAAPAAWAVERNPLPPRVPKADLAAAQAEKNPTPATPESIAKGKELFSELGCSGCHGEDGAGHGPAAAGLDPPPRDFTNPKWQEVRTDGELKYTDFNGSPGTAMIANESMYDVKSDVWDVVNYIRSLKKK